MNEDVLNLRILAIFLVGVVLIPSVNASNTIFYNINGAAVGWRIGSGADTLTCFKVGYSWEFRWCTTANTTPIKMLPLQQGSNYCGQAIMQAFIPGVSQYSLRKELNKEPHTKTYWNDFYTIFDKYGVSHHWDKVSEQNTPIIVGGYSRSHVILVLEKTNTTHYVAFDPAEGLVFPPTERIEQWNGLVIDKVEDSKI